MKNKQESRAEYAVRWRDHYIRELKDALAGREEETKLLAALSKCLMVRIAGQQSENLRIEKRELSEALEGFSVSVCAQEDAYLVQIKRRAKEGEDAAEIC